MSNIATETTVKTLEAVKDVFSLETMEDVQLVKTFVPIEKPASLQLALEAVGGNAEKLLDIIGQGLVAEQKSQIESSADGWMVKGEDGNLAPYAGATADKTATRDLILSMAKSMFDYNNGDSLVGEAKTNWRRDAKQAASDFIKANDAVKARLAKTAK